MPPTRKISFFFGNQDAIAICKEALQKRPEETTTMCLLADLYHTHHGPQKALHLWQAILLELSSNNVCANTQIDRGFAGVHILRAGRLRRAGSDDNMGSVLSSMYNASAKDSAGSDPQGYLASQQARPHLSALVRCWLQVGVAVRPVCRGVGACCNVVCARVCVAT